ncbi:YolD-like family protein [Cytobacillus praedii]|uniref:YolD-like family protein n=1 Tax=Cytobacillus praedii TaxID=1742358 RepID=A0A4R1AUT8_9BACI|nr:YolD-like family protein [Cytobacillus praedii]MED3574482.1 YolD-like family protein [Cytobacillus praedii]TCJ01161.1 YolD-like family protein [Cytobacillus praedii]
MAKVKKKRPTRDEFELEEIGNTLVEAYDEKLEVLLDVWEKENVQGNIIKMDSRTRLIHIEKNSEITKIPFMDIMKVSVL